MADIQIQIPESLSNQLSNSFGDISEKNVLCYHSINPEIIFQNPTPLKGQQLVFSQTYSEPLGFRNVSGKYTNGCDVIFTSLDVSTSLHFIVTFWQFLLHISSILIYVLTRYYFVSTSISPTEKNTPILKLVIVVDQPSNINGMINVHFVCNNYCNQSPEVFKSNVIRDILKDPIKMHNKLFWNSNQKVVQAAVFVRYWLYFEPNWYGNDRYACSRILMKSIHTLFCTYEVMGTITLSQVHNLSISMYSKTKTSEFKLIDKSFEGQYILTSTRYGNYENSLWHQKTGFQFADYVTKKAVYCTHVGQFKAIIDYVTWLYPFRFHVWAIVATFLVLFSILYISTFKSFSDVRHIFDEFLYLIGIFFRVAAPVDTKTKRMYIAVSILGMFHCAIYENIVLSRVVKAPVSTQYLSLANILKDGYKIIWFSMYAFIPPEKEYESIFKLHRLDYLLSSSFHEINGTMPTLETTA